MNRGAGALCSLSATGLARRIAAREVSAVEVMEAHLARIEETNPRLNAVVTLLPRDRLLAAARERDRARAQGEPLGPLHGLPVLVKDLVPTRGVRTTFGSRIFADFVPDEDALIVSRLRAAGAILLGKTNTPEFGAGSQTFNAVFGATRNPWDETKTPGGSSGGAAAALAAGMAPLADGSDFGGSLRNPASFCGVVGLRPSPGRVPVRPDETPWFPVPVQGPMARTVGDAALLLSAIAGPDPGAPLSLAGPGARFREPLERDFRGTRVAWSSGLAGLPFDPRVPRALAPARRALEDLGCVVEDAEPDLTGAAEVFDRWRAWYFELRHGPLLEEHRGRMKDTVVWNIEQGRALSGAALAEAGRLWAALLERARRFFERYAFFALPVSQVPPFDVRIPWPTEIAGAPMATYTEWMGSCSFVSLLGAPALSLPGGSTPEGLPVGLQIVGRPRDDFGVLQLAHALERRPPALPPLGSAPAKTDGGGHIETPAGASGASRPPRIASPGSRPALSSGRQETARVGNPSASAPARATRRGERLASGTPPHRLRRGRPAAGNGSRREPLRVGSGEGDPPRETARVGNPSASAPVRATRRGERLASGTPPRRLR